MGHLGNATVCPKVPQEVKEELWNYYNEKKSQKSTGFSGSFQMFNYLEDCRIGDDDLDEVELVEFNTSARLDSFKYMVEAIGRYGTNLKPPSYHELRVPLLKKELQLTNDMLEDHKKKWAKYGCSIMSDGDRLYELLDAFVERIGEKNVIQVVTNNGSNYVLVGKLLQAKRKNLFWTPCSTHYVNLILEDIGKLPNVKRTLERASFLVGLIYNHTSALSLMRTFTKKKELVRYGVTRFATTYLTLERVHKQKLNLRKMFTSYEWMKSKFYKEAKGKRAIDVILMPSFWNEIVYALKVMGPLVGVLRLVDNEKKPAMGYIYEAMDRAKEAIQKAFDGNEEKYKNVFFLIDKRWENQLHHPLHVAGHFLNPQFFYNDPSITTNKEIVRGLYDCIEKLIPNHDDQDKIIDQLHLYKEVKGMFADPMAVRSKSKRPLGKQNVESWLNGGVHMEWKLQS
ncbi:hypothetical protein SLEP1_g50564 [Rubroshorea leprosula]|uniref:DUF659 domain-containing protein n=1 Tax=Rubroshorea leprosula TaxID=152421 RepID=A0AAV5M0F1_9ROSI|nr:hypothetical protein SLEP1_g50564 [Rubroshorea leprosula]